MLPFDGDSCPLVAILSGLSAAEVPMVGQTLFDAGFRLLEVPLNRPGALDAIRALVQIAPPDALIGGGAALTIRDVDAINDAGGKMIGSSHCDPALIRYTVNKGMLSLPGIATPSEAFSALAAGAHALMLFPAEMIPSIAVRALRSIMPANVRLLPVGSIGPHDIAPYVAAGASGFGIGPQLYQPNIDRVALKSAAAAFMEARAKVLEPESPP